jgi:serine phosphatase RsbU (regulator of sigma subunit)
MATLIIIFIIVMLERKQLDKFKIIILCLYIFAPFTVALLTMKIYGISLNSGVLMLVILLMYCVLNVTQGRKAAVISHDLMIASEIQENILPRTFPFLPEKKEFDLYASMKPAKEIGGDFYDFFMVDDDHLAMVIADVSGKGIPAALFMMIARTLIKNRTIDGEWESPADILSKVNNQLCDGNKMQMFVTAWLGILSLSTGKLDYCNAGHEYPALYRKGKEFTILMEKHSPPLATLEDIDYKGGSLLLKKGDVLFVYTDGVTEANNKKLELYGMDRMINALNKKPDAPLKEIDEALRDDIKAFAKDEPQFDDITMLSVRYMGNQ